VPPHILCLGASVEIYKNAIKTKIFHFLREVPLPFSAGMGYNISALGVRGGKMPCPVNNQRI
jgi:hypothetical protein